MTTNENCGKNVSDDQEEAFAEKFAFAVAQLEKTNGRALLLFNSKKELEMFKKFPKGVKSVHIFI